MAGKQAGPSWPEVIRAIDAQSDMLRREIDGLRKDIKDAVNANGDAIVQSNAHIQQWVISLKDSADKEHVAMRGEYRGGFKRVWSVITPFVLFFAGLLALFVKQALGF